MGAKIESVGLYPQDSVPFEPNWVLYEFVIFCFLVNLIDCLLTLNDLREALDSMQANYIVDEPKKATQAKDVSGLAQGANGRQFLRGLSRLRKDRLMRFPPGSQEKLDD